MVEIPLSHRPLASSLGLILVVLSGAACTPVGGVTYQPPFVPVQFVLSTDGSIAVERGKEITTPIGKIGVRGSLEKQIGGDSTGVIIARSVGGQTVSYGFEVEQNGKATVCFDGAFHETADFENRTLTITALDDVSEIWLVDATLGEQACSSLPRPTGTGRPQNPDDAGFLAAPLRNPAPDRAGHAGVWRFLQGEGNSADGFSPLPKAVTAACGVDGLSGFAAPGGLPIAMLNGTGHELTGITGPGCDTPFSMPKGGLSLHPYRVDVAISWTSPSDGTVTVSGGLSDADDSGGNGVEWLLSLQNPHDRARKLTGGAFPNGGSSRIDQPAGDLRVRRGTTLLLVVRANGDPDYDLTNVSLNITSDR
jgi:hypothetical protein